MALGDRPALALAAAIGVALSSGAFAADSDAAGDGARLPNARTIAPSAAPGVLTGKERLGRKWMDEQRIDNCKVPIDKRGAKPRSDSCPHMSSRPSFPALTLVSHRPLSASWPG
ncbi:hypothetical protein V1281_003405 [Nitrobacteraceae bacterium AZCC 2161]